MKNHEADFTEDAYRELLVLLRRHWDAVGFRESGRSGPICLWRHDVDFSPHRAVRLAEIEAEERISATYFVLLQSSFYNVFEPHIRARFKRIAELGHRIGVHFDPTTYAARATMPAELESALDFEHRVLSELLGVEVDAFSYHNIDPARSLMTDSDEVAGLVNAYGATLQERFAYVSDSNGYWRFRRLHEVLSEASDERLHVLTHPEWWTPQAMAPRERVSRCIDGRAQAQHRDYDDLLRKYGRLNVG